MVASTLSISSLKIPPRPIAKSCLRTRQKPQLDVETGARAQILITLAVKSFRESKVMYFDEKSWKVGDKPVKA